MKLQQFLLNHYLLIDYEEFSNKAICALGILTSIKHNSFSKDNKSIDASIEKVKQIINTTNKKVDVSLFILDRNILPQDKLKSNITYSTTFFKNNKNQEVKTIKLNQDEIQELLCNATMEIHEIIIKEISGFSNQMNFDNGDL